MSPATPLAGDVPPQHLMCSVHSADERRPNHPASGVPVHPVGRQCARAAAYAMLIITRTLPRKQRRISIPYALWTLWRSEIFWAMLALDTSILFPLFCPWAHVQCRGSAPLYVPPFSYKRGRHAAKRTQAHLDVHKFIPAQYITQWSRVLRSGGLNHSKSLCVLVFTPFPN
jgi:hypothetical protein